MSGRSIALHAKLSATSVAEASLFFAAAGRLGERTVADRGFHESLGHKLLDFVCFLCLWFSLPLAIWLRSSWVGLALHWEVVSGWAFSGGRKNRALTHFPVEE